MKRETEHEFEEESDKLPIAEQLEQADCFFESASADLDRVLVLMEKLQAAAFAGVLTPEQHRRLVELSESLIGLAASISPLARCG